MTRVAYFRAVLGYLIVHSDLLNSWKEIAGYLGRGVRTVQRWGTQLQSPVRRPHLRSRTSVTALKSDLDQWVRNAGRSVHGETARAEVKRTTAILKINQEEMHTLRTQVHYQMQHTLELLERACELASKNGVSKSAPLECSDRSSAEQNVSIRIR